MDFVCVWGGGGGGGGVTFRHVLSENKDYLLPA